MGIGKRNIYMGYKAVKVVITEDIDEKISHNIFIQRSLEQQINLKFT